MDKAYGRPGQGATNPKNLDFAFFWKCLDFQRPESLRLTPLIPVRIVYALQPLDSRPEKPSQLDRYYLIDGGDEVGCSASFFRDGRPVGAVVNGEQ